MSNSIRRGINACIVGYGTVFAWAAFHRSFTFFGFIQLLTLGAMLWGCVHVGAWCVRRKGLWPVVGVAFLGLPFVSFAWLWAIFDLPLGPGVGTMLVTATTMAWGYVAPALPLALTIGILSSLLGVATLLRLKLGSPWAVVLSSAALLFHCATIWILWVGYESHLEEHSLAMIEQQPWVTHRVIPGRWDTGRDLILDKSETVAFAGFMSSNRGQNKDRRPGVIRIDLGSGEVLAQHLAQVGDTLALDEAAGLLWTTSFLSGHIQSLNAETLLPIGRSISIEPWPDGIGRFHDGRLAVRVETPTQDYPDLVVLNPASQEQSAIHIEPHALGYLNAAMEVDASRNEIYFLQTGNDATTVTAVDREGLRRQLRLPGIIWEVALGSAGEYAWLSSMTEPALFKLKRETFEFEKFVVPNGIREILPLGDGWLALADYLRAKVYLFDGATIRHEILVGRKPEGMALGPVTAELFVLHDAGLTRIEWAKIRAAP